MGRQGTNWADYEELSVAQSTQNDIQTATEKNINTDCIAWLMCVLHGEHLSLFQFWFAAASTVEFMMFLQLALSVSTQWHGGPTVLFNSILFI